MKASKPMNIPDLGRVWSWTRPGEPQTLRLETRAVPQPRAGEALIANRAIGINPVDWKVVESGHAAWQSGHVPGVDGAGVVAAVGTGVVGLLVGTRVAYHQSLAQNGSFADFTCVASEALLRIPDAINDIVAAAIPCPGLTAWQAVAKVPNGADKDVLVTGAGGAVGLLLAQCCVARGWRVWVTAAPRHDNLLKEIGVVESFDYRDDAWQDRLAAALGPRRLHAIFDTVDSAKARTMAPSIAYNGHLVYIQYRDEILPLPGFTTALSVHEVALNSIHMFGGAAEWRAWREMGAELFDMLTTGQVQLPSIVTGDFVDLPTIMAVAKAGGGKQVLQV